MTAALIGLAWRQRRRLAAEGRVGQSHAPAIEAGALELL